MVRAALDELRQDAADPKDDPTVDQDAQAKAAILSVGLAKIDEARSHRRQTLLRTRWIMLIRAHRETGKPRPKLIEVAERMGWTSEQPLRDYCRDLGIDDWHDVHPIVAAARI